MASLRCMATGSWGAEPVPACSTAAAVEIASALFGLIMAGEIDILGCTGVDDAPGLPALTDDNRDAFIEGSAAAWRMVQERARRHVDLPASAERDAGLDLIAARHLGLCNLAQKGSDRDDFREIAVWQVKAALEAAYAAGTKAMGTRAPERAPDCATARAAAVAGILAAAVMAGEMSLFDRALPSSVEGRLAATPSDGIADDMLQSAVDFREGLRIAHLMISARARASIRTPSHAAISAAEAALALADGALGDVPELAELPDVHAVLASIRDALRNGLDPLHRAEIGPAAA